MYHCIINLCILASLFLNGRSHIFNDSEMVFSDALPVQFWIVNCETYNEHENDGVHYRCFCQPWQCDDEIVIQFQDDPSGNFSLLVYEDDTLKEEIPFEEIALGVYQLTFTPTADDSPEYCNSFIQLKIQADAGQQGISLPSLDTWLTDTGNPGPDWTTGSAPFVDLAFSGPTSEFLYVDYAFIEGTEYTINVNFNILVNDAMILSISVTDGSFNFQFSESTTGGDAGNNDADALVFVATASCTRIAIRVVPFLTDTLTINSVSASITTGSDEIRAKSDCLHIATEQKNTVYATYNYHRNYAGLIYADVSPAVNFFIRIPAIFFHQRFPEEDETILLTDQIVTLNGTMRKQRLLDTDYLPYYFHEKLMLILKQNVEIFDFVWTKQEGYEILEGDRRSPMKKAKCWLSRQDFVQRNVL